jgi:predicted DNA-binding transcriptional regulator AlpA
MQQPAIAELSDEELVVESTACRIIGGSNTPIHRSTLWRGIQAGRYPKPIKVGPSSNRWRVGELRAIVDQAAAARGEAAA